VFDDLYRNRRVLITGHTGFKGSWLGFWLEKLGAELCGVSLPPEGTQNHWALLNPQYRSEFCDIRDAEKLEAIFSDFRPEAVFHLAAQPLVRRSYRAPAETFAVNVVGTANVLEAVRKCGSVRAVVVVTSDKCYENRESQKPYREDDPMGGYDPYSASKGCAELVVSSFRRSFFPPADHGVKHNTLIASGRAGNVLGGGDWAEDRLVSDVMRAAAKGETALIRNPASVRPWQHVLESLSGYLALGARLLAGEARFADGWNFGPSDGAAVTVGEAAAALRSEWPEIKLGSSVPTEAPHEAKLLKLDCSKAERELGWHGVWNSTECFRRTARWYRDFYRHGKVDTAEDLEEYLNAARKAGLAWTK
jgi:CDP-glucose 4,6-dehydratase